MSKWWYLCGRTGIVKYAGEFENYDDAEEAIYEVNTDCRWIFYGKPEIEKEYLKVNSPQRTEFKIIKQAHGGTEETNDRFFINAYDNDGYHVGYLQKDGTVSFSNYNGWFDDYSEIGIAMIKYKAEVST